MLQGKQLRLLILIFIIIITGQSRVLARHTLSDSSLRLSLAHKLLEHFKYDSVIAAQFNVIVGDSITLEFSPRFKQRDEYVRLIKVEFNRVMSIVSNYLVNAIANEFSATELAELDSLAQLPNPPERFFTIGHPLQLRSLVIPNA